MARTSGERVLASLLREGLLSAGVVDSPGFRMVESAARVDCFEFIAPDGTGLVVKRGFDQEGRTALRREMAALADLSRARSAGRLRRALPTLRRLGRDATWLVEERVVGPGALDAAMAGGLRISASEFLELGRAVAELHRLRGRADGSRVRGNAPWPFALASPPPLELLHEASPASLEMLRLVQRFPELHDPLRSAADEWRPAARIHGDLRWENILVERRAGVSGLRVIDWEGSGRGDAAWDLGAFLGESLRVWTSAERIASNARSAAPPAGNASSPHPALSTAAPFWAGYRETLRGAGRKGSNTLLTRAVRFAAVWLLGRVYELAETIPEFDSRCRQSLQLAANILADPEKASRVLFRCGEGADGS